MTMTSKVSADYPCPIVPENFIDPRRIFKLASEIKGYVGGVKDESGEPLKSGTASTDHAEQNEDAVSTPKPRVRTMVATREPAQRFGEILAWASLGARLYGSTPQGIRR
jgi:hypothetical protein